MNEQVVKQPANFFSLSFFFGRMISLQKLLEASPAGLRGALLMMLSTLMLTIMHTLVRYVSSEMHPFEIAFFRNLFGLLAVLPLVISAGRDGFVTRQPQMQILRAFLGVIAMLAWFYGLSVVPIAEATALSFSAAIFASLGAVVFLGEKMRLRRWSAVIVGFIGALVILRPGLTALNTGALIVMLSAICWGTNIVIVKRLSRTDPTVSIVAWMSVMMTVLSIVPALYFWTTPTLEQFMWLLMIGIAGTLGHLTMVKSLKLVEATAVLPLDFTRLIWASMLGYLIFAEIPDIWTWLGGTIIVGSAAFIAYREAQLKRNTLSEAVKLAGANSQPK